MKKRNYLSWLAITATAVSLNTSSAQYVNSVASLKNRAVAASPRAQEEFPGLTRARLPRPEACCTEATTQNELAKVRRNRGLAANPRTLEQFPELARSAAPVPHQEFTIAPLVEKNAAVLSHPRTREEFPGLSRSSTPGRPKTGL